MVLLTWDFTTGSVQDNTSQRPWRRINDKSLATTSNNRLAVTSTSGGYYCDISDLDLTRRWKIFMNARCDATLVSAPTYLLSIGPSYQNTTIGGILVWRPSGSYNMRMDDSAIVTDVLRESATRPSFGLDWFPPIEITYDPTSNVRQLCMYNQGVRVSTVPIGDYKDLDTTYKYLYVGTLIDSDPTPCSIQQITLDTNWDGLDMVAAPIADPHKYWRVRLLGDCTLTEVGLDTTRSESGDDGVTIRVTSQLSIGEGTSPDPAARLYDKLYEETLALTADPTTGWGAIDYTDTTGFDPVQLRIAVKYDDDPPVWFELQYSSDGVTWFLEDRLRIAPEVFEDAFGNRIDGAAVYQRETITGRWQFAHTYVTGEGGAFSNAKSMQLQANTRVERSLSYVDTPYTISIWVRATDKPGTLSNNGRWILDGRSSTSDTDCLTLQQTQNGLSPFTTTFNDYGWYHIVFSSDGMVEGRWYQNGQYKAATSKLQLRKVNLGGSVVNADYFHGRIDEVGLWNTYLGSAAVSELYNNGIPTNLKQPGTNYTQGDVDLLRAWWRFTGSDLVDGSGFSNDLSLPSGLPAPGYSSFDVPGVGYNLDGAQVPAALTAAKAAYGLRLIVTGYDGPIVRVLRSSDSAEADVYIDRSRVVRKIVVGSTTTEGSTSFSTWAGSATLSVTAWYDQTGNLKHVYPTATTKRPTTTSTLDSVVFSGAQDLRTSAGGVLQEGDNTYTFAALMKFSSVYAGIQIPFEQNSSTVINTRRAALICFSGGNCGFNSANNDAHGMLTATANVLYHTFLSYNNQVVNLRFNNAAASAVVPSPCNLSNFNFIMGGNMWGGEFYQGRIYEMLVHDEVITGSTAVLNTIRDSWSSAGFT